MKQNLIAQYYAIRDTIRSNAESIKKLVEQADSLREIVEKLNGTTDESIKANLQQQIDSLNHIISELIEQTDKLFEEYNKFVKAVFSDND